MLIYRVAVKPPLLEGEFQYRTASVGGGDLAEAGLRALAAASIAEGSRFGPGLCVSRQTRIAV
jgi:hypothetical protein